MDYKEYFDNTYPGINPNDITSLENAITGYSVMAFEGLNCVDEEQCALFCQNIKYAYELLFPFEDKIKDDMKELEGNNGFSLFWDITDVYSSALQSMNNICELYHRYYSFIINNSDNKLKLVTSPIEVTDKSTTKNESLRVKGQEVTTSNLSNTTSQDCTIDSSKSTTYIRDSNSDNYVRVLGSNINNPVNQPENKILYECLERLFNYLLSGYKDIDLKPSIGKDTSNELFIYRFSGIRKNDQVINTDEKILWTGSAVLLGYIARCLFSSLTNPPMGITKFASFFKPESGKQFNLPASAKYEEIKSNVDYESKKSKNALNPEFIKAVELLRKCGFINAEYTSKRRETLHYRKNHGRTQN